MCRMYRIYTRGRSAFRVLGVQTRGCKQPRQSRAAAIYESAEGPAGEEEGGGNAARQNAARLSICGLDRRY